ncbi:PAS domain-containing sensor histidine kinase [Spirulina subsalsa]|uniref:sensor histidine kinase n=1 Tax=Spirulina subsalsa TaxID=54311 RepID=UPI0002F7D567|nr:PAS domain-containing sensor histidine kinase [Spirulina subsalsa]
MNNSGNTSPTPTMKNSDDNFYAIIRDHVDLICRYEVDGTILFVNDAYCKYFQKSRSELIGRCWIPNIPHDDLQILNQQYELLTPENPVFTCEVRVILNHGEIRHQSWRNRGIFDKQGELIIVQAVGQDITDSKRSQEALQAAQNRLQHLLSSSPVVIYTRHPNTHILTFISDNCQDILGYSSQDFLASTELWKQRIDPAHRERVLQAFSQLEHQQHLILEYRFLHPDGSARWLRDEMKMIHDPQANLWECIGSIVDISDRHATEEQLHLFKMIVENSQEAIGVSDPQGNIIYTNPAHNKLFGNPPLEKGPLNYRDLLTPKSQDYLEKAVYPLLNQGHDWIGEIDAQDLSGRCFPLWQRINTIRDDQGKMVYHFALMHDVSDRKKAEAAILNALVREKELNEHKSRFISIASHEFRNPLTSILSSAQLLQAGDWDDEEETELFSQIEEAVHHLTLLLEEMKTFNHGQIGKLQCRPVPIELISFCSRLILELERNYKSIQSTEFNLETPDHSTLNVEMDEKLLRQILTNLLSNALKYSRPHHPIRFSLTSSEHKVIFRISDSGIGIPPEDLPHIFLPFHRGNNVNAIPGTGLGLAIVKQAVDLQGGEIAVESQVGQGTTFIVTLPSHTASWRKD